MNNCRSGVEKPGGGFRDCGKPIAESVRVGLYNCGYCAEHAAAARRFIQRQGQQNIADLQSKQRGQ